MRIEHRPPASDLSYKVIAPICVITPDGVHHKALGWTLQNIDLPAEAVVEGQSVILVVPFQGVDLQFPISLKSTTEPNCYSLKNLTGRQREILALFYNGILSGRMASAEGIITSLDTPLDLVPMEQSEDEVASAATPRVRKLKWVANVAFYLVLAGVLIMTVGGIVWDRVTTVPLQHARVVAPIVPHLVATPGYVSKVLVAPGDVVTQGQRLISVNLPQEAAEVEEVRRALAKAIKDMEQNLETHAFLTEAIAKETNRAHHEYLSYRDQHEIGDGIYAAHLLRVQSAYVRWQSFVAGTADPVRSFMAEANALNLLIIKQETMLRRLRRDLGIAKDLAGSADVFAAVPGTVRTVNVYENQHLARAHVALEIEQNTARQVHAWLPEGQFGSVQPGMAVDMALMTSTGPASVQGLITNLTGTRDPMISDEFGLHVVVDVNTLSLAENRQVLLPDAPVQATALRPVGVAMARGIR